MRVHGGPKVHLPLSSSGISTLIEFPVETVSVVVLLVAVDLSEEQREFREEEACGVVVVVNGNMVTHS